MAYPRLRHHYHFVNEKRLFVEVDHHVAYSINVYCAIPGSNTRFSHISNLYHPLTVDGCHSHDGQGAVPGIKTDENDFDTRPHRSRIIPITSGRLALFAQLYDVPGTPAEQARLPVVHSDEVVSVLEKFAAQTCKLGDLKDEFFATQHWNEKNAQDNGTIRLDTRCAGDITNWIVSGPHFHVATPFNKTPNEGCLHNLDYSDIDLISIPDDYLPRTKYVPSCKPDEYRRRTPLWNGRVVTEFYRHVHRRRLSQTGKGLLSMQ